MAQVSTPWERQCVLQRRASWSYSVLLWCTNYRENQTNLKKPKGALREQLKTFRKHINIKKNKDLIQISLDLTEMSYSYTRPSMSDRAHLCQIFGLFCILLVFCRFELLSESTLQFLLVFLVFSMACASSQAVARQLVQEPGTIIYKLRLQTMQNTDYRLQTIDERIQTIDYRLWTTDSRLQTISCIDLPND